MTYTRITRFKADVEFTVRNLRGLHLTREQALEFRHQMRKLEEAIKMSETPITPMQKLEARVAELEYQQRSTV